MPNVLGDEDNRWYLRTPTAVFRVNQKPIFFAPWFWPIKVWNYCKTGGYDGNVRQASGTAHSD